MSTILAIPDVHAPFMHSYAIPFLKELKKEYQPDVVVCLGDETDQYCFSKYPKETNAMNADDELEAAIYQLKPLYRLFPDVFCCHANHTNRYIKRATEAGLPSTMFKAYKEIIEAPEGWIFRDSFNIENIMFSHGENVSGRYALTKLHEMYRENTVIGHLHSLAGVNYISNGKKQIFSMACGCLIDPKTYAFHYNKNVRDKPVLGAGIIIDGIPRFIPM